MNANADFSINDIVVFDTNNINSCIGEIKHFGFCEIINKPIVSLSNDVNGATSCCIDYIRKATDKEIKTWLFFTENFEPVQKRFTILN